MKRRLIANLGMMLLLGCRPASMPAPLPRVSKPVPQYFGLASWYGAAFANKLMASRIPFNPESMVAAHRTLPLGTLIRVHNLRNGLTAVVQVMDRGPFIKGRVLDVSHLVARLLDFEDDGVTEVAFDIVTLPVPKQTLGALWPNRAQDRPMLGPG